MCKRHRRHKSKFNRTLPGGPAMEGGLALLWQMLDARLLRASEAAKRAVRALRVARALLWLSIVLVLASAAVLIWLPAYFPYAYAVAVLVLCIPLCLLAVLTGLPLRAKSVVRLIDEGYPENARELAIRVLARKLRDQSIATEELLVETAVNEARKVYRRMQEADAKPASEDPAQGHDGNAPPSRPL